MRKGLAILFSISSIFLATQGSAQELDPVVRKAPKGLLVRVDQHGNRVVFKSDAASEVAQNDEAVKVIQSSAVEANKITHLQETKGELDRTTSQEAWYYWYPRHGYYPYGYNYQYQFSYYYYANWYGNYYSYYPYYNCYYGGYNWYYYRWY